MQVDNQVEEIIATLPKLEQRQYDLKLQLWYLSKCAIKLGLYDADELIDKLRKTK